VLHYKQLTPRVVKDLRPWAICHSGSGTPFEAYDIRQTRGYRQVVLQGRVPQLGICGGHQLMAEFFGGEVASMRRLRPDDSDANAKYHPGEFKEWGMYPVRIVKRDALFSGCGAVVRVQQFHRSEVKELGRDLVLLASSADCRVQAFVHCRKPLYGVQFHPEEATDEYPDGRRILQNFFRVARGVAGR
jgi:GMP synthase (glutamine-hydrolysing)